MQFAKKLIDETSLPMGDVALSSGFGSVRRFNAGIRAVYHRTPTQLRRLARQTSVQPENQYFFRLRYRPPYDWQSLLRFLEARVIPGVEVVQAGTYRRSISRNGRAGHFEVAFDEDNVALAVRVQFGDPQALFFIIERIRSMFDLNADWAAVYRGLRSDPELCVRLEAAPGMRVPGCWNGFELAVRAIVGQQITVKGASVLAGRIVQQFGPPFDGPGGLTRLFPPATALADARLESIGLPGARAQSIRLLARAVRDGEIGFEGIVDLNEFMERFCRIPGIGQWTAQYVAMRGLGEPDALPSGDLGLLRALELEDSRELERRAEAWRPWRAYGAMYLWNVIAPVRDKSGESISQFRRTETVAATSRMIAKPSAEAR